MLEFILSNWLVVLLAVVTVGLIVLCIEIYLKYTHAEKWASEHNQSERMLEKFLENTIHEKFGKKYFINRISNFANSAKSVSIRDKNFRITYVIYKNSFKSYQEEKPVNYELIEFVQAIMKMEKLPKGGK